MHRLSACVVAAIAVVSAGSPVMAGRLLEWRYLPATPPEQAEIDKVAAAIAANNRPVVRQRRNQRAVRVYIDRNVFLSGDGLGQAVIDATAMAPWDDAAAVKVRLLDAHGTELESFVAPVKGDGTEPKLATLLAVDALSPGRYQVEAGAIGTDQETVGQPGTCAFERSDQDAPGGVIPESGVAVMVGPGAEDWPISTGVPLPRGAVDDASRLVLLEDGKPTAAQWTPRSRWSPAADASLRWVGLDFVARYRDGKPRDYRIVLAPQPASSGKSLAFEYDDRIEVEAGALRFVVRKDRFDGVHAAWLGDRQVIYPGGGPEIVDDQGRRHRASLDPDVDVSVEEQGPVRVVIAARGWYWAETSEADSDAPRLCRFITHITAYRGVPAIFVSQRTIIAYDTRKSKLADVAFVVPTRRAQTWAAGIDGAPHEGPMPAIEGESAWLHQYRDDRVRMMSGLEGKRADGWIATTTSGATLLCTLRDIWQKFPKELEASPDAVTLHFWPRHGIDTFSEDEELDLHHIFKARFAHQGALLDLQMPQRYYDVLKAHDERAHWDPEHTAPIGFASTAEGVAIGNDFALWLLPTATTAADCAAKAAQFQAPPHAIADPAWNVAAGIDAPMAPRDDARWPRAERLLNHDFPVGLFSTIDYVGTYGMWVYANTFNTWRGDMPGLHRIYQNSHYGHVGEVWKLYFRSGSPDLLRWARAQTDHFIHIGTVHHAIPGVSPPGRNVGAMYHAKGFLPWGARQRGQFPTDGDVRNWGHFIDPDAYLWRYLLEGDLFARDTYRAWVDSIHRGTFPMHGPGRESINDLAMLLNAYAMTWDPQMVVTLRKRGVDVTLSAPLESGRSPASFPVWHKRWADRYHMLSRDPRVIDAMASYVNAGFRHWAPSAFVYRHRGDTDVLAPLMPSVYSLVRQVYRDPGGPLDGFSDYAAARSQERLLQLPELMHALNAAGIAERDLPAPVGYYPTVPVYALNPDGRDFSIKLEIPMASGGYDHRIHVISPSGRRVRTILIGRLDVLKAEPDDTTVLLERQRFLGANIQHVPVPAGGEAGLFKLELGGYACQLASPITDLPHEAAVLPREAALRPGNRMLGYITADGSAALTVASLGYGHAAPRIPTVVYLRVEDSGALLLETSLLNIARRLQETVSLPPRAVSVTLLGESTMSWTGAAQHVLLAPRAEDGPVILEALSGSSHP